LLSLYFSNFGPNTTTFVIPGEIYPAEVRATCHGFSAASGKLGAATGAYFFPLVLGPQGSSGPTRGGMINAMFICSFVASIGLLVTYLFIPQYDGKLLETMADTGETYIKLEHRFLWPSRKDLDILTEENYRYHSYYQSNSLSAASSTTGLSSAHLPAVVGSETDNNNNRNYHNHNESDLESQGLLSDHQQQLWNDGVKRKWNSKQ
jgi:hypothetical protein